MKGKETQGEGSGSKINRKIIRLKKRKKETRGITGVRDEMEEKMEKREGGNELQT